MNDFYEQKARKYKYKYLKLKQEIEGGGGRMFGKSKAQKEAAKQAAKQALQKAERDASEQRKAAFIAAEDAALQKLDSVHRNYLDYLNKEIDRQNKNFNEQGFIYTNSITAQDYVKKHLNTVNKIEIQNVVETDNNEQINKAARNKKEREIYDQSLNAAVLREIKQNEERRRRQKAFSELPYEQQQFIKAQQKKADDVYNESMK
jgi:hypothetical protein